MTSSWIDSRTRQLEFEASNYISVHFKEEWMKNTSKGNPPLEVFFIFWIIWKINFQSLIINIFSL